MDVVTKSAQAAVAPVDSDRPNGQAEVVLSTEALDRDGEHLWIDEWKQPLPERIHIDGDHGRSLEKTVGSCVPRIDGNRMVGVIDFAGTDYAQMVRQLVNEGHVRELSVTYTESKSQKDGKPQRELLNAAFVAIPANPEAVVLASKAAKVDDDDQRMVDERKYYTKVYLEFIGDSIAKGVITPDEARRRLMLDKADGGMSASGDNPTVKHDDMVQAIHDAAAHLGAQCLNDIEADPGTADGANKGIGGPTGTFLDGILTDKSSSVKDAGSPRESAEESAAAETAEKSAVSAAADDSADDTAHQKVKEAEKARALAWLISMNVKD